MGLTTDTSGGHFERLANCAIRHEVIIEEETRIRREIADEIHEKVQELRNGQHGLRRAKYTCPELTVEGSILTSRDATCAAPKDGRVILIDDNGKFWIVERWLDNPRLLEPTMFTHDIFELHLYRQEDLRLLWNILT